MPLSLLIADDHAVVREGLRAMLARIPEVRVVGEAQDGEAALALALTLRPDIAILDISMPKLDGLETTRRLLAQGGPTRVLILSMHDDRQTVSNALALGASGYLLKDCIAEELELAIRQIAAQGRYVCAKLFDTMSDNRAASQPGHGFDTLSPRERQVVVLLVAGRRTKEIAGELGLSPRTVEVYRAQIMKKLGLGNLAELIKLAIRDGLVALAKAPPGT